MAQKDLYQELGVSSSKDDVKKAIEKQSTGLFPSAFCKIVEDIAGDDDYCSVIHADGAGTKSSLAYLYYREHNDPTIFRGIAQDSTIMNLDDMTCIGATGSFVISNTIGRNAHRVQKDALACIVEGYQETVDMLGRYGVSAVLAGGETADVGDLVGSVIVDSTVFTRLPKNQVIDAGNIKAGNVIIGLASFGQAVYETAPNAGMGSNGLTLARHTVLKNDYAKKYPESYSSSLTSDLVYRGKYDLDDPLPGADDMTIGQALLSPTRTYLPVMKEVLDKHRGDISGVIHCSGGAMTKSLNFGHGLHFVKDNLFDAPPLFELLLETSQMSLQEAYKTYNMGQRYEIYTSPEVADAILSIAQSYGVGAKVIGEVLPQETEKNTLTLTARGQTLKY